MSMFLLSRSKLPSICFLSGTELFMFRNSALFKFLFIYLLYKAVPVKPSGATCGWLIVTLFRALVALRETCLATCTSTKTKTAFHSDLYLHIVVATPRRQQTTSCHREFYLRIQIKLCQTPCLNHCIAPQFLNDNIQALAVVATMGFHPSFTCYVKYHKNSQQFQTRCGETDFGYPSKCFDQIPDSLRTAKVLFPFLSNPPPSLLVPSLQMDGRGQITIETGSTNGQD